MSALSLNGIAASRGHAATGDQRGGDGEPDNGDADVFGAMIEKSGTEAAATPAPWGGADRPAQGLGDSQPASRGGNWLANLLALSSQSAAEAANTSTPAGDALAEQASPAAGKKSRLREGGEQKATDVAPVLSQLREAFGSARGMALATSALSVAMPAKADKAPAAEPHRSPAEYDGGVSFASTFAGAVAPADAATAVSLVAAFAGQSFMPAKIPESSDRPQPEQRVRVQTPGSAEESDLRPTSASKAALASEAALEPAPVRVMVTGQRTWLEPVRTQAPRLGDGRDAASNALASANSDSAPAQSAQTATESSAASPLFEAGGAPTAGSPHAIARNATTQAAATAEPIAAPRASGPRRDLDVTLEPENLGGLAVRLKSFGDRLDISFLADKSDTARLIGDHSLNLESRLHDAGLGAGGLTISVAARTDGASQHSADAQGQSANQGAHGNWRGEGETAARRQMASESDREEKGDGGSVDGRMGKSDQNISSDRGLYL